jgi:hypothetical protein
MKYIIAIILTILLALFIYSTAKANDTLVYQGVEFDIEKKSKMQERWLDGNNTFIIRNNKAIPVKMMKKADYDLLQKCEIKEDGKAVEIEGVESETITNKEWVYVNTETGEKVE